MYLFCDRTLCASFSTTPYVPLLSHLMCLFCAHTLCSPSMTTPSVPLSRPNLIYLFFCHIFCTYFLSYLLYLVCEHTLCTPFCYHACCTSFATTPSVPLSDLTSCTSFCHHTFCTVPLLRSHPLYLFYECTYFADHGRDRNGEADRLHV